MEFVHSFVVKSVLLQFTLFVARPVLSQFTHFLCGDKLRPRFCPWRNNDKYHVSRCLPFQLRRQVFPPCLFVGRLSLKSKSSREKKGKVRGMLWEHCNDNKLESLQLRLGKPAGKTQTQQKLVVWSSTRSILFNACCPFFLLCRARCTLQSLIASKHLLHCITSTFSSSSCRRIYEAISKLSKEQYFE